MNKETSNYEKSLKPLAKNLRKNSTFGEIILWSKVLKGKQMKNYQFNRQFSMNIDETNIIVDFICRKLKLIIEIDGYSHNFKYEDDQKRDEKLDNSGYKVLRILEKDVKYDLDNVIREIESAIEEIEELKI